MNNIGLSNKILKIIAIIIITIMVFRPVAVIAAEKVQTNAGISTSYEAAAIEDDRVALSAPTFIDETGGQDYYWLFLLIVLAAGVATEELIRIHYKKMNEEDRNK